MKRGVVVIAVLALSLLGTAWVQVAPPDRMLGVRITVNPSSKDPYRLLQKRTPPGAYIARANFYDANNQQHAIGDADLAVLPGSRQSSTKMIDGNSVTLTVAVSSDASRAVTEVVAKRGAKIVMHQESDVVLHAR